MKEGRVTTMTRSGTFTAADWGDNRMADWVLSVLMLAGAGLSVGGIYLLRKGQNSKQGWLMIAAATVMFMNVAIWTIPVPDQAAIIDQPG